MPSSIFPLLTGFFFLLTLDLCSPQPPGPTGPPAGPSGPTGPNPPGYPCSFAPVSGEGPDTTTPEYNAALVSQYSVSEFIQCAGEASTLQTGDDDDPKTSTISALEVLVNATMTCGQYKLSEVIQNYSKTDPKVKLTKYLCGAANDSDVCSLSRCLHVKWGENSLQGVCQNDVNLFKNPGICGSSDDDNQPPPATTDEPNGMVAASSSMTVAEASQSTGTPSTSSSPGPATTTLPTQTASSSPVGSPSTSLGSSSNASSTMLAAGLGGLTAAGLFLIVLMASL